MLTRLRIPRKWSANLLSLCALGSLVVVTTVGCSRTKYRLEADHEVYDVIAERNFDPRWVAPEVDIEIDPRSRYFDPYDPDHSPMPLDDPASHDYMHLVNGTKGWKHWHDNGVRMELENPAWREALAEYAEFGEDGGVKIDINSALRLAYVHSPNHQRQLEELYLSALDVTRERFLLDTQFFGGYDANYTDRGRLSPPGIGNYDPALGRFVVSPSSDSRNRERNRLTIGNTGRGEEATLAARRRLATAGTVLAGFANSFVFEFAGGDVNLASTLANFSIVQPLLKGAGKDIALENLTQEERTLLANLRAYAQFRQGFYTNVAIGESGVNGVQQNGGSTDLQSFSGQGGVNGYLGLLLQLQRIRNSNDNLRLQLRTLDRLEALLANDLIDIVQVDQFRQSVESQRAELLLSRNQLELALDRYKTSTLGLPPDLSLDLDDTLIQQFQLIPREATELQDSIVVLQQRVGQLPNNSSVEVIAQSFDEAALLIEPLNLLFDVIQQDIARMDEIAPTRLEAMTEQERTQYAADRVKLGQQATERRVEFDKLATELTELKSQLNDTTRAATLDRLVSWTARFLQLSERIVLVPARARLETVTVEAINLSSEDAYSVALANRLDFMNGRAALVDQWRDVHVKADALQSVLTVSASGDLLTARNNAVSFRAPTATTQLGLQFDAPFTRLEERNAYRASLISYQRSRRSFIQSQDSLNLGLRALVRQLEQLRENLEIQRRAVAIAIRRVDQTQLSLNPPRQAPQPGQRPPINPTTAINLLSAQTSLQNTQNNFLSAWLNYDAARLRLYRELGIMVLDPDGRWIEYPIEGWENELAPGEHGPAMEELPIPPMIEASWADFAESIESHGAPQGSQSVGLMSYQHHARSSNLTRIPPIPVSRPAN